jgi:hypothetical protein
MTSPTRKGASLSESARRGTGSLPKSGERSMRSPSPPKPSRLRLTLNRDGLALLGSVVELRELMPYAGHADQYRPMLR